MTRILSAEQRKLSHSPFIYACIAVLCFLNVIFLWADTQSAAAIPPSAYKKMTSNLQGLSMEEKSAYISGAYETAYDIYQLDYLIQYLHGMDDPARIASIKEEIARINEKYPDVYASGSYLNYTDNIERELLFLSQIQQELTTVSGYEAFLEDVQTNAARISGISIFADAKDNFEITVAEKTAQTYASLNHILLDYSPQKGIYTVTDFKPTDSLFLLGMLFLAIALVRGERDGGLLHLIRSMPRGRLQTALAKMCVYAAGLGILVAALYGTNIIYCWTQYGLGDLSRSIQSVPTLMRSTLQISVGEYLALYFLTKWLGAFSIGAVMLVCVLAPSKPYTGYLLCVLFTALMVCVRVFISPTGRLNVLKYANSVSVLATNELLGDYRLLYFFGVPVPLMLVEVIYALATTGFFCGLFCMMFAKAELHNKKTASPLAILVYIRKKFTRGKLADTTPFRTELYKTLVLNGAVWVLLAFLAFQGYQSFQRPYHMGAEEMYYRYYAKHIEGRYTKDKYEWLAGEYKKFEPLLRLQQSFNAGLIDEAAFSDQISLYSALQIEYGAFQKVMGQLEYMKTDSSLQFVYETGYLKLFSPYQGDDLIRCIIAILALILMFSNVAPAEYSSGMIKLLQVTPNGHKKTVAAKLKISVILAALISAAYQAPGYFHAARDYGLGTLMAPARSIEIFADMPKWVSLLGWMAAATIATTVGFVCICLTILAFSVKVKTQLATIFLSMIVFAVPVLFTLMGSKITKWFSIDVIFSAASNIYRPIQIVYSFLLLVLLMLCAVISFYHSTDYFCDGAASGK